LGCHYIIGSARVSLEDVATLNGFGPAEAGPNRTHRVVLPAYHSLVVQAVSQAAASLHFVTDASAARL